MSEKAQGVREGFHGIKPPEEPVQKTREETIAARITELCETNSRRALEDIARGMGFEPTKTEYPNKIALATAIAEKEFPEPEEVTDSTQPETTVTATAEEAEE